MGFMKQDAEGIVFSSHKEELPLACIFSGVPPSAARKSRSAPLQEWQCLFPLFFQRLMRSLIQ